MFKRDFRAFTMPVKKGFKTLQLYTMSDYNA
jgi:hypothetical protein